MPDKKITQLPNNYTLDGNELFEIVQAADNKKVSLNTISTYITSTIPPVSGSSIITVSFSQFQIDQAASNLITDSWYFVTNVWKDPIWNYDWTILARATSNSTLSDEVFAIWNTSVPIPTTSYPSTYVSATLYDNTLVSTQEMVFNECVGEMMVLTAAQADLYNNLGVKYLRENIPVIILINGFYAGSGLGRFQAFVKPNGTEIWSSGYITDTGQPGTPAGWLLDYASNIAYPTSPFDIMYPLTNTDLNVIPISDYLLIPACPFGYWTVLNAQVKYTFNSNAYSELYIGIKSASATHEMARIGDFKDVTANCFVVMPNNSELLNNNPIQYVVNDDLEIRVKSGGGGDGSAIVYATIQLAPL